MTASNTAKTSVLAEFMQNLLKTNKTSLGLQEVYYGQQSMIPVSPVVVVTPGEKTRDLAGVSAPGGRTDNWLTVYVDVLSSKVGSEEEIRKYLDELADSVEEFLHQDTTMEGYVIHGFVISWDPGITFIANSQFRTVRLTWRGRSKTYLSVRE